MPWPMSTSTREFIKGKKYISSAKWKTKEKYMGFRIPLFWSIFIFLKSDFGIISGVVANCLLYCVRYDDTIVWTHSENPTWRILLVNTKHIPTIQKVHIGGKTCDKLAFIYKKSIPQPQMINTPGSSPNQVSGISPNQVRVSVNLLKKYNFFDSIGFNVGSTDDGMNIPDYPHFRPAFDYFRAIRIQHFIVKYISDHHISEENYIKNLLMRLRKIFFLFFWKV